MNHFQIMVMMMQKHQHQGVQELWRSAAIGGVVMHNLSSIASQQLNQQNNNKYIHINNNNDNNKNKKDKNNNIKKVDKNNRYPATTHEILTGDIFVAVYPLLALGNRVVLLMEM